MEAKPGLNGSLTVSLIFREDASSLPAGDVDLAVRLGRALSDLGVRVVEGPTDSASLVHFIGGHAVERYWARFSEAIASGLPVVITAMYWSVGEALLRRSALMEYSMWERRKAYLRAASQHAWCILATGYAEKEQLENDLGCGNVRVIRLGVDPFVARAAFYRTYGLKQFIFQAARICQHKNQLALVRAVRHMGIPVVLAGSVNDPYYLARIKQEWRRVFYVGHLDKQTLSDAYSSCLVHVLPSWYELPGLSTLEAYVSGARCVSTERGTAREYLGAGAVYCDPDDEGSIRRAIEAAISTDQEKVTLPRWTTCAAEHLELYWNAVAHAARGRTVRG
ncbi:MAG: glycosyltransferase family 4 protein [Bacillota bacterium]